MGKNPQFHITLSFSDLSKKCVTWMVRKKRRTMSGAVEIYVGSLLEISELRTNRSRQMAAHVESGSVRGFLELFLSTVAKVLLIVGIVGTVEIMYIIIWRYTNKIELNSSLKTSTSSLILRLAPLLMPEVKCSGWNMF